MLVGTTDSWAVLPLAASAGGALMLAREWLSHRTRRAGFQPLMPGAILVHQDVNYLCQSMPHLAWIIAHDRQSTFCNQKTLDYIGVQKLSSGDWINFLHPDDRAHYRAQWEASYQEQTPYVAEYRLRRNDGSYRWHLSRGLPVFAVDGTIEKWIGTSVDIHERKMLQAALREVDDRLQAVSTHASLMLWGIDMDGKLTYALGQNLGRLGVDGERAVGQSAWTVFAENKTVVRSLRQALEGTLSTAEFCVDESCFEMYHAPLRDRDGVMLGAVSLALDVTERKKSQDSYRDTQRLSLIVEAQHRVMTGPLDRKSIMASILSAVGRLCAADDVMVQVCEKDELVIELAEGISATALHSRSLVAGSISGLAQTDNMTVSTADLAQDARFTPIAGQADVLHSVVATPIHGRDGILGVLTCSAKQINQFDDLHIRTVEMFANLLSTFWVQASVSDAKEQVIATLENARHDLIRAREGVEQGARLKTEFLANMSHEIRTPLNGIIGMTDLILDTELNDEQSRYAHIVQESGTRLLLIINDILDYSKIEAGRFEIESIPFSIADVVGDTIKALQPKAQQSGLAIDYRIDAAVPQSVSGDPARVGQVLLNIIGNAIKFSQSGKIIIDIRPAAQNDPEAGIRFEVSDTGLGIDPTVQSRLFQPFTQADGSTARRFGGTGLGLSICKRLVELMGGTIGVDSILQYGSQFWFVLPLRAVELGATPVVSSPQLEELAAATSAFVAQKAALLNVVDASSEVKHILIADDNKVNLLLASKMLQSLGYTTQTVDNGLQVLEALKTTHYDLVLMDCQMPEMDGFAATQAIRQRELQHGGHIPIVALTANTFQEDVQKCLDSGMDAFLGKPIRKEKLGDTLQQFLKKRVDA